MLFEKRMNKNFHFSRNMHIGLFRRVINLMFMEHCTCHQENQPLYDFAALTAQSLFFRNLFSILHQPSVIVQLVRLKPGRNPKEKMLIKKLFWYILPAGIHWGQHFPGTFWIISPALHFIGTHGILAHVTSPSSQKHSTHGSGFHSVLC